MATIIQGYTSSLFTLKIDMIHRIICDIRIQIDLILIPDGISLKKAAKRGRVAAGLVVVHAQLGQPGLPGVLEPAGVARARDAVFVIGVHAIDGAPCVVGDKADAALPVGPQEALAGGGKAAALVPGQRIVGLAIRTMDIAAQQIARAVVFGEQFITAIKEPRGACRGTDHLVQATQRIIAQLRIAPAARANQPVLDVIQEAGGSIRRETDSAH